MLAVAAATCREVAEPCLVTIALAYLAAVAALDSLDPSLDNLAVTSLVVDPAHTPDHTLVVVPFVAAPSVVVPLVAVPLVVVPAHTLVIPTHTSLDHTLVDK